MIREEELKRKQIHDSKFCSSFVVGGEGPPNVSNKYSVKIIGSGGIGGEQKNLI